MEGYTKVVLIMVLALVMVARNGSNAQICGMAKNGFDACEPAVAMNDPKMPVKTCCDAIEVADLKCLCSFANSPILKTLQINKTAAMALPVNCNLDPNFHCQNN